MEFIYLFFVLLLYFPLTVADKISSEETEDKGMLFKFSFCRSLVGIAVGCVMLLFSGSKIHLDFYTVLTSLMYGAMMGICMIVTFYSMQVTTIAVSSVFRTASVIIPCVFGAVFWGENISVINVFGFILLLISGYMIVSKKGDKKFSFGFKALFVCIGVMAVNGMSSVAVQLFANLVPNGDETVFLFIAYCMQSVILYIFYLLYLIKKKGIKTEKISSKMWIYSVVGTVTAFLIQQIITKLASIMSAMIIFPVTTGGSVVVSVVTGWMFFKEKSEFKSIIGIVLGIISVIMINMF